MHLHYIPLVVVLLHVIFMEPSEAQRLDGAHVSYTFRDPITECKTSMVAMGRYISYYGRTDDATGRLVNVLTKDGGNDGCTTGVNLPSDGSDWIALIERGGCTFQTKVHNHVVKHDASAVLIYNNVNDEKLVSIRTLPVAVFLRKETGTLLAALLDMGKNVTIDEIIPGDVSSGNCPRRDVHMLPNYYWRRDEEVMLIFVVVVCAVASLVAINFAAWKIYKRKLQRVPRRRCGGTEDEQLQPLG